MGQLTNEPNGTLGQLTNEPNGTHFVDIQN